LMVGAGGAARGAIGPVLAEGPAALVIVNRTYATATALAAHFGKPLAALPFDALEGPFDIIINATSASIAGVVPPLPESVFGPATLALDMMYGAAPTAFMVHARARGASVRDGLGMLVGQAAEAFTVWRGVRPDSAAVMAGLRERL
jgi:shikimate dehydrogenase